MALEQDIANMVSAADALTQEVAGKMNAIDARVAAKEDEVDVFLTDTSSKLAGMNLLLNSTMGGTDTVATASGTKNAHATTILPMAVGARVGAALLPQPASSAGCTITEAGRFYQDNSTNGGAGSPLGAEAQTLLDAMGDSNRRYGTEFIIANIAYDGSSAAGFPVRITLPASYFSAPVVFGYWMRVVDNPTNTTPLTIGKALTDIHKDGNWHFISGKTTDKLYLPYFGASVVGTIQIALPSAFAIDAAEISPITHPIKHLLEV